MEYNLELALAIPHILNVSLVTSSYQRFRGLLLWTSLDQYQLLTSRQEFFSDWFWILNWGNQFHALFFQINLPSRKIVELRLLLYKVIRFFGCDGMMTQWTLFEFFFLLLKSPFSFLQNTTCWYCSEACTFYNHGSKSFIWVTELCDFKMDATKR